MIGRDPYLLLRLNLKQWPTIYSELQRPVNSILHSKLATNTRTPRLRQITTPALLLATSLCFACSVDPEEPPNPQSDPIAHKAQVDAWHETRLQALRRPDGYLTLVGLTWLREGVNTLGAGPGADVVLPAVDAPDRLGQLLLDGRRVTLEVAPGGPLRIDGEAATSTEMQTDAAGEPTVVELESLRFFAIRRGDRTGIRMRDSDSPVRSAFTTIARFPVSLAWHLNARFEPAEKGTTLLIPNIIGGALSEATPGTVHFEVNGKSYSIAALEGGPSGRLFLVFGDTTNGDSTYAGGRFLYAGPADEDGTLEIDFNRAYNPPCVFTPWATCPLPPMQNRMPFPIPAGEMAYASRTHEGH